MSSMIHDDDVLMQDGFSAQQLFRHEESDGLTFDDIISLVRLYMHRSDCSTLARMSSSRLVTLKLLADWCSRAHD